MLQRWQYKYEEVALDPQHLYKKLSTMMHTCNHSAGEAETGGSLKFAGQASLATLMSPGSEGDPVTKKQSGRVLGSRSVVRMGLRPNAT